MSTGKSESCRTRLHRVHRDHDSTLDYDPPSDIFPFTEDAISEIHRAAEGNIRRTLMICNQAIDIAIERGVSLITSDELKKLLPDLFELAET